METAYSADPTNVESAGSLAGYPYAAANEVSYHLDLRGPTIPTTTACSFTATTLYLAVQTLRTGDCEAAVVGGCQLNYTYVTSLDLVYLCFTGNNVGELFTVWKIGSSIAMEKSCPRMESFLSVATGSLATVSAK
ncbi:uncharacterized protein ARMOST_14626 [Armillaria ostoyae]|uniref:Beta-ketoacyl synthase-like N-terminal domain-containing protein n=1 Tax=Armillaria ostoyae TaxID=47428 RepID=A0A284RR57_ARMOS|nr:uncharacterized protein ARMOST_14626 [Armillaria ostoyae]